MERSFLDYSMSVITARALPDVKDGLKPVQRRILWGMYDIGARPDRSHMKCARVTGEDAVLADAAIAKLMGEDVESRKQFIITNADDVRFLDI